MVQGELFREENPLYNTPTRQKSFLGRYQVALSLDKLLIVFIANIAIFALTYSFGVEHGKRAMENHFQNLFPAQSQTQNLVSEEILPKEPEDQLPDTVLVVENHVKAPAIQTFLQEPTGPETVESVSKQLDAQKGQKTGGNFTIQLVTYDDEGLAKEEIRRLKTKGFGGFVIPSGRFYQVCVNYFETKTKAKVFLSEFRQNGRYPDAYIRPVVR